MFNYRLTFNHSGRLNRRGEGLISIEIRDHRKRIYISTNIHVKPDQFDIKSGEVINHPLSNEYRTYLLNMRYDIEKIELDNRNNGYDVSLNKVRHAYKNNVKCSATIAEFTQSVINNSNRSTQTKNAYKTMVTSILSFDSKACIDSIDHDWIERYRSYMKDNKLSDNTVKGRLKQLHCITQEAIKRDIIKQDPFKWITIGNMTPKKEYLTTQEMKKFESAKLSGKESIIRDLFLLSCYTGLRWSDLITLNEATIENGILRKKMYKTKRDVAIPIDVLFWGKGRQIIDKYKSINRLCKCVKCNSTANRVIKSIATRLGIKKPVHFHIARKTCSSLLYQMGLPMQDISIILGHSKIETTQKYYVFGKESAIISSTKKLFK